MRKRLLSVLLCAAMAVSMMAGCGKTTTQTPEPTPGSNQEAEANNGSQTTETVEKATYPLVDKPITLKAVYVGINPSDKNTRLVWDRVAEVTGITLEWEVIAEEALPTYLAGGEWPDVFFGTIKDNLIYDYGVLGGRFVDYSKKLNIMPNLVETMEDYPLVKKASTLVSGHIFKIARVDKCVTSTQVRPHTNTDALKNAGVEMPTTVAEFEQALKDLKAYYGVPSFIPKLNTYKTAWAPMLYAAFGTGCDMQWDADDQEKVYFPGMSEQMRRYYTWMNSLYEQGLIHPEVATIDSTAAKQLDLSGTVAFMDYGGTSLGANEAGEYPVTALAPLTSEYDSTQEILGAPGVSMGPAFLINAKSKYVDELCKLLDIAYAKEEVVEGSGLYGISFGYGMENEQWKFNEDGITYSYILPEGYDNYTTFQKAEIIWNNQHFGREDAFDGLVTDTPGNAQSRQLGYEANINPYLQKDPFPTTFLSFTEDQQYVIDNKWSEIDVYVRKMQVEFITGVTDIETGWDEYCDTLVKMGINDVIAVYQEAYDSFRSR